MVESCRADSARPASSVVASLARFLEAALVRIGVAVGARREFETCIHSCGFVDAVGRMTFDAGHRRVRAGQDEPGCGVVEPRHRPPTVGGVAARTGRAQLTAMLVEVAARAVAGQTQIRAVQIGESYAGPGRGRNLLGPVTGAAWQADVFPREDESCLAVVQRFAIGLPVDKRKVGAVVIRVTGGARFTALVGSRPDCVHPSAFGQSLGDFRVAGQALQLIPAGAELVTLRAVERTAQRFVSARQRAGRNLGITGASEDQAEDEAEDRQGIAAQASPETARRDCAPDHGFATRLTELAARYSFQSGDSAIRKVDATVWGAEIRFA